MKVEVMRCDICDSDLEKAHAAVKGELLYSMGGWGSVRDHTKYKKNELCQSCYEGYQKIVMEFVNKVHTFFYPNK